MKYGERGLVEFGGHKNIEIYEGFEIYQIYIMVIKKKVYTWNLETLAKCMMSKNKD